jgi:hypothetical protein
MSRDAAKNPSASTGFVATPTASADSGSGESSGIPVVRVAA